MKGEEKLEALLLEILGKLEIMPKKSGGGEHNSAVLSEVLKEIQELRNSQFRDLLDFFTIISKTENAETKHLLPPASKNHHYLWFFPDLKAWFALIRRGTWVITFAILFFVSAGINFYIYNDFYSNRISAEKYRFLVQRGVEYTTVLDSVWQYDDFRNELVQWTVHKEDSIRAEIEKQQRVRELQQELSELTKEE